MRIQFAKSLIVGAFTIWLTPQKAFTEQSAHTLNKGNSITKDPNSKLTPDTKLEEKHENNSGTIEVFNKILGDFDRELNEYIKSTGRENQVFFSSMNTEDKKKIDELRLKFSAGLKNYTWDGAELENFYSGALGSAFFGGVPSFLLVGSAVYDLVPFEQGLKTATDFLERNRKGEITGQYSDVERAMSTIQLESFVRSQKKKIANLYNDSKVKTFRDEMAKLYIGFDARDKSVYGLKAGQMLYLASLYGDSRALDTAEGIVKEVQNNPKRAEESGDYLVHFYRVFKGQSFQELENHTNEAVNAISDFSNGSDENMKRAQTLKNDIILKKEHLKNMLTTQSLSSP